LAVPCDRSTAPFSWGRLGVFQIIPIPRPISHNANSVGKSPFEPHGTPLSTRSDPGKPQREKARRNRSRTSEGGTWFHLPRGENRGLERRAAALIN
jgi:hypothetical protein